MATTAPAELLQTLRADLAGLADPSRAPGMQAYMKSAMPYHGVPMPQVRALCRSSFKGLTFEDAASWRETVLALWHGAAFREEWYAAIAVTGLRSAERFQTPESLSLYEELIVTGAWWDVVDEMAVHRLGKLLQLHPTVMQGQMLLWSQSDNLWKRRSAILCQVGVKEGTDLELLYACIEPAMASREFFLRKAIGWALRQVAWQDPQEVMRYVRENEDRLSPLSKREALKNIARLTSAAAEAVAPSRFTNRATAR